jgi:hypothetical protein
MKADPSGSGSAILQTNPERQMKADSIDPDQQSCKPRKSNESGSKWIMNSNTKNPRKSNESGSKWIRITTLPTQKIK